MSGKPLRPDDSDCCGSGCKPCIFDVYEERLRKWESKMESFPQSKALDQIKYLPFVVIDIQSMGKFLKKYSFQAVTLKKEITNFIVIDSAKLGIDFEIFQEPLNIKLGEYLIIKGIYEAETISRSYTPISNKENFTKGVFSVIISLLPNGKMSDFLTKLKTNDIVFWRGPFQEFVTDLHSFKHILLFGGGTGVVPLYNIAKTIVEEEENEIWVKVLASFKNVWSIILRKEFGSLRDYWNFQMDIYMTDQNQVDFKSSHNESIIFNKINETVIKEELGKLEDAEFFIIICGPEGFNHFIADTLKRLGVQEKHIFIFW